ncbi:LAQU0S01e16072g1_1 [Lachancea quebecensis]|uniref:LAQU0S01e16072g1_1 n=1 Tax=Lachancea quebecensis TaxID=1654605 RepID=A0A0P1KQ08_9SACH|nr:LAQU0S01e16072g1_1 [Lachancea quebecensis]
MEPSNDEEAFFRVISENMKYAFTSPIATTTQFPTPYSQAHNNTNSHNQESERARTHSENQSMMENSMLTGSNGASSLSDVNVQPSSVLQLGNEFMLTSPEQFREFLFESPAGINLLHRTPAKTPLRFFNSSAIVSSSQSQSQQSQQGQSSLPQQATNGPLQSQITPLRNIDVNLMFNSRNKQTHNSSSPSKRYLSLTPYGKRVLSDIGTPYAKLLASSNSALVDFQRARKDVQKSVSPEGSNLQHRGNSNTNKRLSSDLGPGPGCHKGSLLPESDDEIESGVDDCGSSPTTIQLNSSVTKSARDKLGSIGSIREKNITNSDLGPSSEDEHETNIDERLFEMEKLPLSPTPKPSKCTDLDVTRIKIPELPKMGSFKSERSSSVPNTAKKTAKKQPKFQIIVTDANSFNSTRGTVMGGDAISKKRKPALKRSQSEIVSTSSASSSKGKTKRQKLSQVHNFPLDLGSKYPDSQ